MRHASDIWNKERRWDDNGTSDCRDDIYVHAYRVLHFQIKVIYLVATAADELIYGEILHNIFEFGQAR